MKSRRLYLFSFVCLIVAGIAFNELRPRKGSYNNFSHCQSLHKGVSARSLKQLLGDPKKQSLTKLYYEGEPAAGVDIVAELDASTGEIVSINCGRTGVPANW